MKNEHYINNKEFSQAVYDYTLLVMDAKKNNTQIPQVPNYIAECFLKIAYGIASKPNYSGYTYKEEMIMDGVENCLRAVSNFKIDAETRKGLPNAFGYFSLITSRAFHRRIVKEKKQQDIKMKYMKSAGIEDFVDQSLDGELTENDISRIKSFYEENE